MQYSFKSLIALGAIATLTQADTLPSLFGKRDEATVSGHSAGGHFSCHLMWTASDTWKGAGCSKSGGFDMNLQDMKNLTDEMVQNSITELKKLNN